MTRYAPLKTVFIAVSLVSILAVTACKPKPEVDDRAPVVEGGLDNNGAAGLPPEEVTAPTPSTLPEKPEEAVAAGKLAGSWVNAGGACDSGIAIKLEPNGAYLSEGETGSWTLDGKKLSITTTPDEENGDATELGPEASTGDKASVVVLSVLSVTEDAAKLIRPDGSAATWTRCND